MDENLPAVRFVRLLIYLKVYSCLVQESSKGKSPCSDNQGAILEVVSICQSVREYENESVRRGTEDGVNRGMDDTV